MKACELPIGVFDSGVGGLTVARAIQTQLPQESVIYFGDRARCPYGDQAPEDVLRYAIEISEFLLAQPVKCIVIACNTATAVALPTLRSMFSVPVIGVIEPGAAAAVATTRNGRIGVIGTSVTIQSHAYRKAIVALDGAMHVVEHACPDFVPLVERGQFDGPAVEQVVRDSLLAFADTGVDTLVLGCTHYPLLQPVIRRVLGPLVQVISSADATANVLMNRLNVEGLTNPHETEITQRYFTTGDGSRMWLALANWFGKPIASDSVVQVQLPLPLRHVVKQAAVQ
ncbi:glutamate racemase [Alicyclobacillus fastidiosus]|uniref:Glutamate racemase n=1 Tax=Alicyclobacillus fastidiosus TaxID=392011 RepID=A0ABY6ZP55_9BACL|nr:glutamate racemase [Alicyclobacillus fastidiosus]WAH44227.1 glutamate racemase [Alicyclobacillus fastidiosus]GMA60545.1 glutamate racemase 1 [Alicyclobacillus fastidiosus]